MNKLYVTRNTNDTNSIIDYTINRNIAGQFVLSPRDKLTALFHPTFKSLPYENLDTFMNNHGFVGISKLAS